MKLKDRIQHAWNTFTNPQIESYMSLGPSSWTPQYTKSTSYGSESFVSAIYNRIAIDVSMARIRHVKVDPKTEDVTVMKTGLNECLTNEANIDQTGIQFIHDLVYSMFDEGVIAVVPVDTTISPRVSGGYDINSLRVGKVVQWYPKHVRINLYNEATGQNEDVTLEKSVVAIIENPLYAVMNAPNSTLKRLITKINQLDEIDAASVSGRMNMIIHVPYSIKTQLQKDMAAERIKEIEHNLSVGKHGITYMDATEKVTPLNRSIETTLPDTIDRLMKQFYNQLGLTQAIFDGSANEEQLRVYYSRTIDPIVECIVAEFRRKFLTKTARTQGQDIEYYRDMFKFVTVEMLSGLGDTVRRNSILTSNEFRKIIGIKPSSDPRADELFNPNIADKNQNIQPSPQQTPGSLTSPENEDFSNE